MEWFRLLGVVADLSSLIALATTAAVWWNVRRIREFYRFRARIPEVVEQLNKSASNVSRYLSDFDASEQSIELEFAEATVFVRSLAKKSSGEPRSAAKRLAKRLERRGVFTARDARELYVDIRTLLLTFREVEKDYKWEP